MSATANDNDLVPSPSRGFAWTLIIAGFVGLLASLILTIEEIEHYKNINNALICDLNPLFSCTNVMTSEFGHLLGFPNPLIGLAAFVAPISVGVGVLAGARFKPWFWRLFIFGIFAGFVFVIWLFLMTTFVVKFLCIFCIMAWAGMIPLFWKTILWAMTEDLIQVPEKAIPLAFKAYDWSFMFALGTELIIATTIIIRFWDSWYLIFV